MDTKKALNRRQFLTRTARYSLGLSAAATFPGLLAACGDDDEERSAGTGTAGAASPAASVVASPGEAQERATVLVGDVVDFRLRNEDGWRWPGGWIVLRLHAGAFEGKPVYFVRTDASDETFADSERLVYVPKLRAALDAARHGDIYLIENGTPDQAAVVSTAPGQPNFTPLLRVHRASWTSGARLLQSVSELEAESSSGALRVEDTSVVVNYPFVKWVDGELPVDSQLEAALSGGPLVSAPDLSAMTVKFKLHQCYPQSYYIITDTSALPMAGMMNVAGAPLEKGLVDAGATERIYVFANGIPGFAAMGFQPSVFASKAGEPAWSPMWEHVTVMWKDENGVQLLKSRREVESMEQTGELQLFPGTPDTNGESFVVNCPAPIVAPNTFSPSA